MKTISRLGSKSRNVALTLGMLSLAAVSQAALTWTFNYGNDTGIGFHDDTYGADRRLALQQTADIVSSWFVNYDADLIMDVTGRSADDGTLMSAGSENNGTFSAGFNNRGDVGTKILGGTDPSSEKDGTIDVNFFYTWNLTDSVPNNEYDFKSVMSHELLHAIGFLSDISESGTDSWGSPLGEESGWVPFDQFVSDSAGSLIDDTTFKIDVDRWNTASLGGTGESNGLFFNGANAMAANGGKPVNLYSPHSWEEGSSGSHLDTDFFTSDVLMMEHAAGQGQRPRTLSAIEIGILKDIGFTNISAVPEPSTIAAIALGALGLLYMNRRRNAKNNIAA